MKIDYGIASILLFKIDIPLSSENIQFGAKIKPDDKVELRKALRPLYLPLGQHLGSRKVLKVFVIYNNIDGKDWTLQVVLPNLKASRIISNFLSCVS